MLNSKLLQGIQVSSEKICVSITQSRHAFYNQSTRVPILAKGPFNNYVDKMRGRGGQKMSVFVHAKGIKTVHAGGKGVKKR